MKIFDLHCDTVSACLANGKSLLENDLQLDLMRGKGFESWIQVFAFFVETKLGGSEDAYQHFLKQLSLFTRELEAHSDMLTLYEPNIATTPYKCNAILAIEGGHVLNSKLSRISELKKLGISILTLVWNGDNEIACGIGGSDSGITEFGKAAIAELEKNSITVDISHLNEKGIEDVFNLAKKPIVATHSNARNVHDTPRNLYDYQLKYLIENNGLCGFNFYPPFVTGNEDYTLDDMKRHLDHILSLGGENILAIGSDFDGASMPTFLRDITGLYSLYNNVVEWYGNQIADKIFYDNGSGFFA